MNNSSLLRYLWSVYKGSEDKKARSTQLARRSARPGMRIERRISAYKGAAKVGPALTVPPLSAQSWLSPIATAQISHFAFDDFIPMAPSPCLRSRAMVGLSSHRSVPPSLPQLAVNRSRTKVGFWGGLG